MENGSANLGVDVAGLGKIAEAIPKEVYENASVTVLGTFEKLIAPITETTQGFGLYLRQKFENMVDAEKAIATYTLQKAVHRAEQRCKKRGIALQPPPHPKTFVKAVLEASMETNGLLHEMWTNLLASQMSEVSGHPHFVEILSHFSPMDAQLLISLHPLSEVEVEDSYVGVYPTFDLPWIRKNSLTEPEPWNIHCDLLFNFRLAHVAPATGREIAVLYRTQLGLLFLTAVGYLESPIQAKRENIPADTTAANLSTQGMQDLVRKTMHDISGQVISVDTTQIAGPMGQKLFVAFDASQTVLSFMTQVYQPIQHKVPPYSYGTRWVLEEISSGIIYDANSNIERQALLGRTIGQLGFRPGMHFKAVWTTPETARKPKYEAP